MSVEVPQDLKRTVTNMRNSIGRKNFEALFATVVAANMESRRWKDGALGLKNLEEAWGVANDHLSRLAEMSPRDAFDAAVNMVTLPAFSDPDMRYTKRQGKRRETIRRWVRTSGLTILGMEEVRGELTKAIRHRNRNDVLARIFESNMGINLSRFGKEKSFRNPLGFTALQTIFIALQFSPAFGGDERLLHDMAMERVRDPNVMRAAEALKTFAPGCAYIAEKFTEALAQNR